jgi:hypothetical protein
MTNWGNFTRAFPFVISLDGRDKDHTARLVDDFPGPIAHLSSPAHPNYRTHPSRASLPERGLRDGQVGGLFLYRRSALLAETSDSGHPHQGNVPHTNGSGAWLGGDVESRLMDSAGFPLCSAGLRRSTQTAGHYWVLPETGNAHSGADQSDT